MLDCSPGGELELLRRPVIPSRMRRGVRLFNARLPVEPDVANCVNRLLLPYAFLYPGFSGWRNKRDACEGADVAYMMPRKVNLGSRFAGWCLRRYL